MMHLDGWQLLADEAGRLNPIHDRHLDVHHDQVGDQRMRFLHGVQTVLGLADDHHVIQVSEQRGDRPTEERLVVNQKDADRFVLLHLSPRRELALDVIARGRPR